LVRQALAGAQKGAQRTGQRIIWVDESGFYLLPAVVRSYAPRTQTPILRVPLTRDHLSVISGITLDDRLLLMVHERPIRGPEVVRFLQHLLRHIPGKLLVIWDGAPIHHGKAVQAFLAAGGAARLQLEVLPGYAPDLNPDEGIWNYLKRVELRNLCCATLRHLHAALRLATARLRHKHYIIHSCFHQAGYRV
jgi:transposase